MSTTNPTPRDFPVLYTRRRLPRHMLGRYRACHCCHLMVAHRNARRHEKACARRKKLAPELWREWREDMRR